MREILQTTQWKSESRLVAGVMSGTSMDGIDVSIARFTASAEAEGCRMEQEASASLEYSAEQRRFLLSLLDRALPLSVYSDLPVLFSRWYAEAIRRACDQLGIQSSDLDAIGVHGQTLWHAPELHHLSSGGEHRLQGEPLASTLQLCSLSTLAQDCECVVVGDFRPADIAMGGQGAPLVPIFDLSFLQDPHENRVALNIGGMANLTVLAAQQTEEHLVAFDSGPGNVWIDAAMQQLYGRAFDEGGECARGGNLHAPLLERLQNIEYVHRPPPKSTGREYFSREQLREIMSEYTHEVQAADLVHTLSEFTIWSIAQSVLTYAPQTKRLIVSGGGSQNTFLMEGLSRALPGCAVVSSDSLGIPSKSKESLCFAYLAWRSLAGLHSNIPSVSGAKKKVRLGQIALP